MNEQKYLRALEDINLDNIYLQGKIDQNAGNIELAELLRRGKLFSIINLSLQKRHRRHLVQQIQSLSHPEPESNDFDAQLPTGNPRIIAYTCITGNYDCPQPPLINPDGITYRTFTDANIPTKIAERCGHDPILTNRYLKFHPHELFNDEYDYAIYLDGNIRSISDLRQLIPAVSQKTGLALHRHRSRDDLYNEAEVCVLEQRGDPQKINQQITRYRSDGFPKAFGLYECSVIVSDLKNSTASKLLDDWWQEFQETGSKRDQLALPYVIWKNGYEFNDVSTLGNNVYKNPLFRITRHRR